MSIYATFKQLNTIALWIKPTDANGTTEIVNIGSKDFTIELNNSYGLQTDLGSSSASSSTNIVPINEWSHIVFNYDSTTLKGYLNGVEVISLASANNTFSALEFDLGHINANNNFNGYMSDVYFVEAAIPASVFGGPVDGVWMPKTYTEVVAELPNYPIDEILYPSRAFWYLVPPSASLLSSPISTLLCCI